MDKHYLKIDEGFKLDSKGWIKFEKGALSKMYFGEEELYEEAYRVDIDGRTSHFNISTRIRDKTKDSLLQLIPCIDVYISRTDETITIFIDEELGTKRELEKLSMIPVYARGQVIQLINEIKVRLFDIERRMKDEN